MNAERPSERVIAQRMRNRMIEALDLAASFDKQLEYEANVPIAHVPSEVICWWEDSFMGPEYADRYELPVYTPEEVAAMVRFHAVWDRVCEDLPGPLSPLRELFELEPWQRLRDAAAEALAVFMRRGKFSEDVEERFE